SFRIQRELFSSEKQEIQEILFHRIIKRIVQDKLLVLRHDEFKVLFAEVRVHLLFFDVPRKVEQTLHQNAVRAFVCERTELIDQEIVDVDIRNVHIAHVVTGNLVEIEEIRFKNLGVVLKVASEIIFIEQRLRNKSIQVVLVQNQEIIVLARQFGIVNESIPIVICRVSFDEFLETDFLQKCDAMGNRIDAAERKACLRDFHY